VFVKGWALLCLEFLKGFLFFARFPSSHKYPPIYLPPAAISQIKCVDVSTEPVTYFNFLPTKISPKLVKIFSHLKALRRCGASENAFIAK
jgi:hypothetical protein